MFLKIEDLEKFSLVEQDEVEVIIENFLFHHKTSPNYEYVPHC